MATPIISCDVAVKEVPAQVPGNPDILVNVEQRTVNVSLNPGSAVDIEIGQPTVLIDLAAGAGVPVPGADGKNPVSSWSRSFVPPAVGQSSVLVLDAPCWWGVLGQTCFVSTYNHGPNNPTTLVGNYTLVAISADLLSLTLANPGP